MEVYQMQLKPEFIAMAIGSMPFEDPEEAVDIALAYFKDVPFWPQLPRLGITEQMTPQYSEGMPCIRFNYEKKSIYFDTSADSSLECAEFYEQYIAATDPEGSSGDCSAFAISGEYSKGLYAFEKKLKSQTASLKYVKVHAAGPCSFALTVADENKQLIFYNETFREIIAKAIAMKCRWQIQKFSPFAEKVICFLDEPVLSAYGSSVYLSVSRADVVGLLSETVEAIHDAGAIAGIHCCGNTEWSMLADAGCDIISFDAFEFGHTISLYPETIGPFLQRGGMLAWGIVPTSISIRTETVESLREKLETAMDTLASKGIDKELICRQAIITPSCGTGAMQPDDAYKVFETTANLSAAMKQKYGFSD